MLRTHFSSRPELERKMAATRQVRADISGGAARLLRWCAAVLRMVGRVLRSSVRRS